MLLIYMTVYILVIFFCIAERLLRKGSDAKTMEQSKYDRRTTAFVAVSFVVSVCMLIVDPILNHYRIGMVRMSVIVNIIGVIVMLAGVAMRIIAAITLGRFYTRTLRKTEYHEIVTKGIYHFIRHPGYLGTILLYVGAGIAMGNIFTFMVILAAVIPAYLYRIRVEENMLVEVFGAAYTEYLKGTKRLVPFLY